MGSASDRAWASAQLVRFSATRSSGWDVPVRARSSIAFLSGASARGTESWGAARFRLGAACFAAGRFGTGFLAFALGARETTFLGAVFFLAPAFFTAGLRAFGFAFFAAIESPPDQGRRNCAVNDPACKASRQSDAGRPRMVALTGQFAT